MTRMGGLLGRAGEYARTTSMAASYGAMRAAPWHTTSLVGDIAGGWGGSASAFGSVVDVVAQPPMIPRMRGVSTGLGSVNLGPQNVNLRAGAWPNFPMPLINVAGGAEAVGTPYLGPRGRGGPTGGWSPTDRGWLVAGARGRAIARTSGGLAGNNAVGFPGGFGGMALGGAAIGGAASWLTGGSFIQGAMMGGLAGLGAYHIPGGMRRMAGRLPDSWSKNVTSWANNLENPMYRRVMMGTGAGLGGMMFGGRRRKNRGFNGNRGNGF